MPRESFERSLKDLQDDMMLLGYMVDTAIDRAVSTLQKRDLDGARAVIEDDKKINAKRYEIEQNALLLLATQQPMAGDLRTIAAVMNIITDLERMGDHAEGVAKITLLLGEEPPLKPLIDIPRMAEKARDMLRRALQAFVDRDEKAAMTVASEDDYVDDLYNQVYRELLTFMIQDPRTISRATHLLWAAHNLERIADRVTNICERVVFLVTGRMEELSGSAMEPGMSGVE